MALSLPGSGSVGYSTSGRAGAGTYSWWAYRNSAGDGSDHMMFNLGTTSTAGFYYTASDSTYRFEFVSTGADGIWSVPAPSADAWHHIMVAKPASTAAPTVYIDGVSQTVTEQVTPGGSPTSNNLSAVKIGYSNTVAAWDGYLAEYYATQSDYSATLDQKASAVYNGAHPFTIWLGQFIETAFPLRDAIYDMCATNSITTSGSPSWDMTVHTGQPIARSSVLIPFHVASNSYDETTGSEVTIRALTSGTDTQTFSEITTTGVVVKAAITGTDTQTFAETTNSQTTILVTTTGTDTQSFAETAASQVTILAVISGTDTETMLETAVSQVTVLVVLTGTDTQTFLETTGSEQTILVVLSGTDTQTFLETSVSEVTILVVLDGTDSASGGASYNETTGEITVLVTVTGTDQSDMLETAASAITVLVVLTGTDVILRPSFDMFFDNFDDNSFDTTKWQIDTSPVATLTTNEQNQRLEVDLVQAAGSNYGSLYTARPYSLLGTRVSVEVPQVVANTLGAEMGMLTIINGIGGSSRVEWWYALDGLHAHVGNTDVFTTTYSATNHRWVSIRESGGTTYWETSPDGITWTEQHSETSPFYMGDVYAHIWAGTWQNTAIDPGQAFWDNFNTFVFSEVTGEITILVTTTGTDAATYPEVTGSQQTILATLSGTDTEAMQEFGSQTILATLSGSDTSAMQETTNSTIPVIVILSGIMTAQYIEPSAQQTILATLSGTDIVGFDESNTGTVIVLVPITSGTDTMSMFEVTGEITVLVLLSGLDQYGYTETTGEITILVVLSGVDTTGLRLSHARVTGTMSFPLPFVATAVLDTGVTGTFVLYIPVESVSIIG